MVRFAVMGSASRQSNLVEFSLISPKIVDRHGPALSLNAPSLPYMKEVILRCPPLSSWACPVHEA